MEIDKNTGRWLKHEFGLERLTTKLLTPSAFGQGDFIDAVRGSVPRGRRLTAAEISELCREHTDTIEPAHQARTEIFALENQLSDLVNEAYSLTPEEVALMWRTAPPRMPFTPAGLASDADEPDADDGDGEDE